MIKRHLILAALVLSQLCVKAQVLIDSVGTKVRKTEIELVYNHYLQDGNNSAVTGGIGTEKLTVFGPSVSIVKTNGSNAFKINLGADIISSASTDKIDYVVSSASSRDSRYYTDMSYERKTQSGLGINGGLSYSIESDYFSQGYKLGINKSNKEKERYWFVNFQYFNDDLRWGRINPEHFKPVKLIYPSELRDREWFDSPKRHSFNLKTGLTQTINKRKILGIFPELAYLQGLLATPVHRVYFTDNGVTVEQLPSVRHKAALAIKLNTAINSKYILKNGIQVYTDDFGIRALSFEHESMIKINPFFSILPNFRINTQKASKYFAPFQQHAKTEVYYTSDYDLSGFQSYLIGMGFKYNPYIFATRKILFNTLILRYSYMYRSNGLQAHILSLVLQTAVLRKNNK